MKSKFFDIYDAVASAVPEGKVCFTAHDDYWALTESGHSSGLAMYCPAGGIEASYPGGLQGLSLREAAECAKSWNLEEAGFGMAAANAGLNTPERLEKLGCYEPFENYCTGGLDFRGKTVGIIGHMRGPKEMRQQAKEVYIIEREPRAGDYPDSACDYILPQCDIVLITGSTLVNKTLPHLLDLCRDAYTILIGPTVPMCPELLDFGIDRIAGLVVDDRETLHRRVMTNTPGTPYFTGRPFLIVK